MTQAVMGSGGVGRALFSHPHHLWKTRGGDKSPMLTSLWSAYLLPSTPNRLTSTVLPRLGTGMISGVF